MNWYAGYASEVGELLHLKYQSFEAMQGLRASRSHLRYPGHQIAREIRVDGTSAGWNVTWRTLNDVGSANAPHCDVFDAVIVATGFGSEARTRDAEASLYWLDDTLERERPSGRQMRYLISGTGDGGLTDLLRIRVKSFRHHHLRDCLLDLEMFAREIEEQIEGIECDTQWGGGFNVTEAYKRLAGKFALGGLMSGRREGTSVVLTNRESGGALASPAWRVSKFLAAQLLVDDPRTQYRMGPAQWDPIFTRAVDPKKPPPHPDWFDAKFAAGWPAGKFDAVVVRHGPELLTHPQWGTKPIPAVDFTLTELGFEQAIIEAARAKWAALADLRQATDECIDENAMSTNCETSLRSRAHTVLPAIGGRTVIGMLSRLVSSVGPEAQESPEHKRVVIKGPLVADDVAALLTQIAYRFPHGVRPRSDEWEELELADDHGWRLGSELNRTEALEIIWAADFYLRELWKKYPEEADMLERNWVLPRTPWSSRGPLLEHTCVARHPGPWQMKYLRDETPMAGGVPKSRAARERRLRQRLAEVPMAAPDVKRPTLMIVDYCALQHRLAVTAAGTPRAWRLARELQAQTLYMVELDILHDVI
jgi:hypothetical protein